MDQTHLSPWAKLILVMAAVGTTVFIASVATAQNHSQKASATPHREIDWESVEEVTNYCNKWLRNNGDAPEGKVAITGSDNDFYIFVYSKNTCRFVAKRTPTPSKGSEGNDVMKMVKLTPGQVIRLPVDNKNP